MRRYGAWVAIRRWEQKGVDLAGARMAAAVAETREGKLKRKRSRCRRKLARTEYMGYEVAH